MRMRAAFGLVFTSILTPAAACDSLDDGDRPRASDGGDPQDCGGTGCANLCSDAGTDALEWMERSELGVSAEELFGPLEGSCEAPFSWDGASADPIAIDPPRGETTVTVSLELDHDSARLGHAELRGATGGRCDSALTVDGRVRVRTEDGVFDDEGAVTVAYRDEIDLVMYGFSVPVEDLGGTLSVQLGDADSGSLSYRFDGAGDACAGEVRLETQSSSNGMGMASSGALASWSSSGCPVGQRPIDPREPGAPGAMSIAEAIAAAFGDAVYPGEWDDGVPTELELSVAIESDMACRTASNLGEVFVAVRARYGTSDGRIESHEVPAQVRVELDASDAPRSLQLWIDDLLRCADEGDELPYTLLGCDELESVEIQLGVNASPGRVDFSDEGLNAYESHRDGDASPGAADEVRRLLLPVPD